MAVIHKCPAKGAPPSSARPAKKARSASYVDTRKNHASPLGNCRCTDPASRTCKRCGVTKVKLDFSGVGFDVDFQGMLGRKHFYVLASKDVVVVKK